MSKFLEIAIKAAKSAETIILNYYKQDIKISLKSDQTPVTIADRLAEEKIIEIIKSSFPGHSFLGEESGEQKGENEYTWIIDPIDGTKNYSRNIPLFGTQIALMQNGEIILGLSNMPAMNEMICAEKGKGAYLNSEILKVSIINKLEEAFLANGAICKFKENNLVDKFIALESKTRGHRGFGDCWMYHLLAQGKIDIATEARVDIWDIAAISLIITEAGGMITDLEGNKINKDTTSILASNPFLHAQILKFFVNQ